MKRPVDGERQVWVWVEHYRGELAKVSLSLLGKAHELCRQLGGGEVASVLFGAGAERLTAELINYGADKVYLADGPSLSLLETERCAGLMAGLIRDYRPEVVLWGATSLGRETAARVAAGLRTGLTAHCVDL